MVAFELPDAVLVFSKVVLTFTVVEVDVLCIAAARTCCGNAARFTSTPIAVENATFQAEQRVRCGRSSLRYFMIRDFYKTAHSTGRDEGVFEEYYIKVYKVN